jgi:hypothetical protein
MFMPPATLGRRHSLATLKPMSEGDANAAEAALQFFGQTLDWLEGHHSRWAEVTTHDLDADERVNAIWKLSGESLAHARAYVGMLQGGYTAQAWPTMRAIHEAHRLLGAVVDPDEERIVRRWLADQEVKQAEARAAEEREADRIAAQMKEAGLDPPAVDVAGLSRTIYSGVSKAPHHRRSVVDESVDAEARRFTYGTDPDPARRLEFVIFASALINEVLLKVGDALCALWGRPASFIEHLQPMLRQFEEMVEALDVIDTVKRFGA